MSWTKKVKHPSKMLEIGQEVDCQVLEVDAAGQAHQPRPQAARARSVDALHGQVQARRQDRRQGPLDHRLRRLRRHRRGRGRHGPQDATCRGPSRSTTPPTSTSKGDEVEAIILSHQPRREEGQPRRQAAVGRSLADGRDGQVQARRRDRRRRGLRASREFGAFVRIGEGIEGLVPISEIPPSALVTAASA